MQRAIQRWVEEHSHELPQSVIDRWTRMVQLQGGITVENLMNAAEILADPNDGAVAGRRLFNAAKKLLQYTGILPSEDEIHGRHKH